MTIGSLHKATGRMHWAEERTPHAEARIDRAAIRDNAARLCDAAGSVGVMAVVKGDGYGHGMIPCARAAMVGGATSTGAARMHEAPVPRASGISSRILTWLPTPRDDWASAAAEGIEWSVGVQVVEAAPQAAQAAGRLSRRRPGKVRRRWLLRPLIFFARFSEWRKRAAGVTSRQVRPKHRGGAW
ncbi:alanine racemase [Streptomyces coffeae]|uniref:Alanine racemase n=1 Tax=Streptomyces coffeae TaxID=621382 RepID=A0ABS1NQF5_9ACTN|nr:alanine racemase [Streptomyces coffeae]MBL1102085.1 alanine racemase [Streptomyces coffeae]